MQFEKNKLYNSSFFLIVLLVALSSYLFIFKIGQPSLWEADEAIYGRVAKEILKFGDWATLRFNHREWFDKPPLYMWLTASFYYFFGWSEFTIRIWSALFGVGQVIVVYFFGKTMFSKRAGFFSALMLATSLQFIIQSRLALVDVPLSFFISLSLFFFYLGYINPGKKWYYLFSACCMALATLTKGPIGVLFPVFIIGIYLVITKNLGQLKKMKLPWLVAIFLLVASPWYIIELMRHGRIFLDHFFLLRMVGRYRTAFEGHTGPVYYYFLILLLGFFPWSSFLPYSFVNLLRKIREWKEREREKVLLIAIWFIVIFVFFTMAKSKLPGYILPLYPACALSVGWLWDECIKLTKRKGLLVSYVLFFLLVTALIFALIFIAKFFSPSEYSLFSSFFLVIIAGLFIGGIFSFIFLIFKKNVFLSLTGLVGAMFFLVGVLTLYILPLAETFKPMKLFAHQINSIIQPGEKIGNYPASDEDFISFDCTLIYYSDYPVIGVSNLKDLKLFLTSEDRVYCVMSETDYQEIKEQLEGISLYILNQKSGEILFSNEKNE